MNPFFAEPSPVTPGFPMPLFVQKNANAMISPEAPQKPLSPSLIPNIQTLSPGQVEPQQRYRSPTLPRADVEEHEHSFEASPWTQQHAYQSPVPRGSDVTEEVRFEVGDTARGRTPHRPASPSHTSHLQSTDAAKPQKRSRSPVKKFLGFGKSTSLKDIPNEPRSKSNSASPEKNRTPLKTWGNRIRHGFLVRIPSMLSSLINIDRS